MTENIEVNWLQKRKEKLVKLTLKYFSGSIKRMQSEHCRDFWHNFTYFSSDKVQTNDTCSVQNNFRV